MMKGSMSKLVLLLVTITGAVRSSAAQPSLPDLIDQVKPSIVIIETFNFEGTLIGTATGFFIDAHRLVTTRHAVFMARHVAVVFPDDVHVPVARVIAEDEHSDLILLEIDEIDRHMTGLIISEVVPRDGEDIFVIGGPLGFKQTVSTGIISGRTNRNETMEMLQITAAISLGSSGSPVLNMKGEVIGIAAATIPEGEGLNFAIPADRIQHLVDNPLPFAEWAQQQLLRQKQIDANRRISIDGIRAIFPIDIPEEVEAAALSVVTVATYDESGETLRRADGFFVTTNRVLTPRSILLGAHRAVVLTGDDLELTVEGIVGDDPVGELVLLEVTTGSYTPSVLDLGWRRPYREEPLIVIRSSDDESSKFVQMRTTMTITDLPTFGHALSTGPLDALTVSGSPVVSVKGRVIAIVNERVIDDATLRFLTPADRIRDHMFPGIMPIPQWVAADDGAPTVPAHDPLRQALPFILTQRWDVAAAILEKDLSPESTDVDRWMTIALCRNYQFDWPGVIKAANRALELKPDSSLACFLQAIGYSGQVNQDPVMALTLSRDACRKAIKLDPKYNYHSYIKLAAILGDFGELEQAATVMESAVVLWPDRPEIHQMLASVYMWLSTQLADEHKFSLGQKYRKLSIQESASTIALAPYASWAYRQFAQSAALNESSEPAITAAKKAVALSPNDPQCLGNLGRIYLLCGDRELALETYETLLELDESAANALLNVIQSTDQP